MHERPIKYFFTFMNHITIFSTNQTLWGDCKLVKKYLFSFALIFNTLLLLLTSPAFAAVIRNDQIDLAGKHYAYLYRWVDPQVKTKAAIIAIHGFTMHGLTYDHLA